MKFHLNNPNAAHQGENVELATAHPLATIVTAWNYYYTHSTIINPNMRDEYISHTFKIPGKEHSVSLVHLHPSVPSTLWRTQTSPASGRMVEDYGPQTLTRHLAGKARHHKI